MSALLYMPQIYDEATDDTPWFVYDQAEYKFFYFATEEEAIEYFEREVKPFYREADTRGFCPDIAWVLVGKVTHVVDCTANHTSCLLSRLEG